MNKCMAILILFLCIFVLSGCKFGESDLRDKTVTLTVLDKDADVFKREYLPLIKQNFPNWEIRTASYNDYLQNAEPSKSEEEQMQRMFDEVAPDLVIIRELRTYQRMMQDNYLTPLGTLSDIEDSELNQGEQELLEPLKGQSGDYYGLATHFSSNVLYYNIDLFQSLGIPKPTSGIYWKEVIDLASRFSTLDPGGEQLFGLYYHLPGSGLYDVISIIAATMNINEGMGPQMKVLTDPGYEEIWEYVLNGYKTGAIFNHTQTNNSQSPISLFADGRIAMIYGNDAMLNRLQNTNVRWASVPEPVNPAVPDVSYNFHYHAILSGFENSIHREETLELIKFLTKKESMEDFTREGLPLTQSIAERRFPNADLQGFYSLRPRSEFMGSNSALEDIQAYYKFRLAAEQHAQKVLNGSISVRQALGELLKLSQTLAPL